MMNTRIEEDDKIVAVLMQRTGISVNSVFDLVNSRKSYAEAIPILLEFLPSIKDRWIKQGIVRALSVKEARGKVDAALVKEFQSIPPDDADQQSLKWAIGNALSVVATDAIANELLTLAQDKRHGTARQMIVVSLGNLRDSNCSRVLIDLLNDDQVCGHAIIALRKLKAREAIPFIQKLLSHPKAWIRKEAKKALSKL